MLYRLVDWTTDKDLILNAIDKWEELAPYYKYITQPNKEKVTSCICKTHPKDATYIVDGSFLVLVDVITPWFADDVFLQELLVLSLKPRGRLRTVPLALECIARDKGASRVLLSDSSIGNKLSKLYSRYGYIHVTNQFYKEI